MDRKPYIDGLRGVAALIVLVGHSLLIFVSPLITLQNGSWWSDALGKSPLGLFWNGNSAVCIFFALSGFVMAQMTSGAKVPFFALVTRRYLRLALPILISSSFAYLLLRSGLFFNDEASQITNSGWLGAWYRFAPSGRSMVAESLWGTFLYGHVEYNSNLWTMNPEMFGSLWIISIWALAKTRAERLCLLVAFALLNVSDYRILFAAGAALYEFEGEIQLVKPIAWLLIIVGAYLCGFPASETGSLAWYPQMAGAFGHDTARYWHELGAIAFVTGILASAVTQRMFSGYIPQLLGRISFTLYLIHLPLLCGPVSWLIIACRNLNHHAMVLIGIPSTIASCVLVSIGVYRFVDVWPVRVSRSVGEIIRDALSRGSAVTVPLNGKSAPHP